MRVRLVGPQVPMVGDRLRLTNKLRVGDGISIGDMLGGVTTGRNTSWAGDGWDDGIVVRVGDMLNRVTEFRG